MATSKDSKALGYHNLVYNIDQKKYFFALPGDQYYELKELTEVPQGNTWIPVGGNIYYPHNVYIGGVPPASAIELSLTGDAKFNGQVEAKRGYKFPDGTVQMTAADGSGVGVSGVSSVNGQTGDVVLATSDLNNDSGFITIADVPTDSGVISVNGESGVVTLTTEDILNNSGYITLSDIPPSSSSVTSVNSKIGEVVLKTSDLENDSGYTTFSGAYADLTGQPAIPTNNNQLVNGAGYITSGGSPSFAGRITAPDFLAAEDGSDNGAYLVANYQGGAFLRLTTQEDKTGEAVRITNGGFQPSDSKITLNYDGSATFADKVTAAGFDLDSLPELA